MFLPKWLERTAATSYRLGSGEARLGLFTSGSSGLSRPGIHVWNASVNDREWFHESRDARMNQIAIEDFAKYLARKNLLPASEFESVSSHHAGADQSLRKLWETTELTAMRWPIFMA
jgi:hypothetical protein